MSLRTFSDKIEFNTPGEEVFKFFTDSDRMPDLFPGRCRFRFLRRSSRHLSQGVLLECKIRFCRLPLRWKIEVTSLSAGRHITSVWQQGARVSIEHNSYFESLPNGRTRVTECVLYQLPLGPLMALADHLWIRPSFQRLFNHRRKVLLSVFKPAPDSSPSSPRATGSSSNRNGRTALSPNSKGQRRSADNLVLQKQT